MDTERVAVQALDLATEAKALVITGPATYRQAVTYAQGIKDLRAKVRETFGPLVKKALETHRAALAAQQAAEAPLIEAEAWLKDGMSTFDAIQERIRQDEEARRQAQAKDEAETRRVVEAAALEMDGQAAEAASLLDDPIPVPIVIVPPLTPKVAGVSHRELWSARVVSLPQLVDHVAAHHDQVNLLQANQPALNTLARALKGTMQLPGVEAVCTPNVAIRR